MKRFARQAFFASFLIIIFMIVFSGCGGVVGGAFSSTGKVIRGESAYEVAVRNGFSGTEAEWLESLKGKDGRDGSAVERGYSAYEIAVRNGFSGTEAEWLQSIVGERGSAGFSTLAEAANRALLSTVSVVSTFSVSGGSQSGAGAGVIIGGDKEIGEAYIITNFHVVFNASASPNISTNIRVFLYGMQFTDYAIPAGYFGGSMTYDLAVLKVENSALYRDSASVPATIKSSSDIAVGEFAVAVGNPGGKGISATAGVISVDSEYLSITAADDITTLELRVMRIDAAVNRGNSGGGLFNGQGELIGIVNAKIISDDVENIGYAIPSDIVLSAIDNIMRNCDGEENTTIKRCMVGVSLTVQDSKAVYSDSSKTTKIVETVKIQSISAGSAAEGKLEAGDIILSFSFKGKTYGVARLFTLVDFSLRFAQNDVVSFSVERGGELMDVEVTLSSVTEIQ